MKLDDFLKVKQVRCVSKNAEDNLTIGRKYKVTHIIFGLQSDNNSKGFYDFDSFEPVLADNCQVNIQDIGTDILDTNADIKDTPKFKVGDRVYYGSEPRLLTIAEFDSDGWVRPDRWVGFINYRQCCHATTENYERLQATFTDIEFEQPPKELKGSDLCFKKLKSGKKLVICAVSDLSDEKAIKRLQDGDTFIRVIKDCDPAPYHFIDTHGIRHGFAVPLNDETGEPLTEAMLDE